MARVKFLTKTKLNPANIYVRFYHSKDFDLNCRTGYLINPKLWSNKQQRVKTTSTDGFDRIINPKLSELKDYIIFQYNLNFQSGKRADKDWLARIIAHFNRQPLKDEDNPKYFLVPFFENFIEESKFRINPNTNKPINSKTISKYNTTLERIKNFENHTDTKLRLIDVDLNFHQAFINYLVSEWFYNGTTNQKHLNIIKSVCKEAKLKGLDISAEVESKKFTVKRETTYDTYLSEVEISKIYNLNLKGNPKLDIVRDWIIVGVWTGLRVSDLKRLNNINLKKDTINIITSKTTDNAIIPIHPQVKSVLDKYNGEFPPKLSEQHFNEKMKVVARKAEIEEVILGKKPRQVTLPNGQKVYRDKLGQYSKCELISTHTCRRSFATNLYGKIPNRTIMAITTHRSEAQFEKYLKQSQMEHVHVLKEYWKENSTPK